MREGCAYHPAYRVWVTFHIRVCLCFVFAVSAFLSVSPAAANEQSQIHEILHQNERETMYIIPDQPESPLKFGVAITPDEFFRSGTLQLSSAPIHPFDEEYRGAQNADVTTVVRIALDEFKFFSGINHWVQDVEKTMNGYTRKLMLTGEFKLNSRNTDAVDYIKKVNFVAEIYKKQNSNPPQGNQIKPIARQFEINKVTWNTGFHFNQPNMLFMLGIGDAIMIQSFIGEDVKIGAMIKLSM